MSAVPVLGSAGNPGPQNPESKANTNLIVNYLPQNMTEDDVKGLFETVGHVLSCKLIKDKGSQVSLGYAFVNYSTAGDAEKALKSLNGLPLQDKTIKVSYARPSSVAIKNANLYVAYLPKSYTQTELDALFRPFGTIITSKVLIDTATGVSRGVGFVRFDKHSEAESAINSLNGRVLPASTQPLLVKFANQPKVNSSNGGGMAAAAAISAVIGTGAAAAAAAASSLGAAAGGNSGVTAGGLAIPTATLPQPTRRAVYNAGGPVRHAMANLRYNPVSPLSSLAVNPLNALGQAQGGWCIFVYNLPEHADDSLLYQLFCPFGAITSVKVIKDQSGKCKRYGFVNMVNYEEAYQAIVALNGYTLDGKQLQVSFKTSKN